VFGVKETMTETSDSLLELFFLLLKKIAWVACL